MAGGGVGEAMLIGAAVGAGTGAVGSAIQKKDIGEGALLGALGGAATGGIGSQIGGAAAGALPGAETAIGTDLGASTIQQIGQEGGQEVVKSAMQDAATQELQNVAAQQTGQTTAQIGTEGAKNWGQQGIGQGMFPGMTNAQVAGAGTLGGITGLAAASNQPAPYQAPGTETYNGPLSKFKMAGPSLSQYNYDPSTFKPSIAPGYADGGIATLGQTVGQGNTMYPQSQIPDRMQFSEPTQMPTSAEVVRSDYDTKINPYTGEALMARGGIADLGSYSDGGRLLRGPGDGMSDNIPASIAGKQPARLADGEFVVPADVVSHLGNGSTDAGAKTLYGMMDKVRKARTGSKKQGREINADKYMPKMARGGIAYFDEGGETTDQPVEQTTTAAAQPAYNPSVYTPTTYNYSPYTVANRPSGNAPQYYGDIYQGAYPDYSTPGYTLTGGNLGRWSNVAGEQARAAQPASLSQQVTQSYLQNLGRAPDQASFDQYMQSGLTGQQINKALGVSGEAVQVNPANQANQNQYISDLYQQYLGRAPEAAGKEFWTNIMSKSPVAGSLDVMRGVANSPESQIRQAYQTYLGRAPEAGGLQAWHDAMAKGMTPEQMRAGIISSPEAQAYASKQQSSGIASLT